MKEIQMRLLGALVLVALLHHHQSHALSRSTSDAKNKNKELNKKTALHRQKRDWIIDTFTLREELPGPYPMLVGTVQLEEEFQLQYKLQGKGVDEDPKGLFHINEDTGSIYVHQKIDYEQTSLFQWKFNAINKTTRKVGTRLGIHLKILDINDNAPEFKNKTFHASVNESAVQGNTVFTLLAYDKDSENSPNSLVSYFILSQTPTDPNVEFTVDQDKGFISFKGCLSYETNRRYRLMIEAKDKGVQIQLSSTCEVHVTVLDRNTNAPIFSSPSLQTSIPEHEANLTILRFGVTDSDTPFTSGWRAVYSIIEGNNDDNYEITTDPQTNEGILTVVKPLDYEERTKDILSIAVSNEEPLYSCKVKQKPRKGLWEIEMDKGRTGQSAAQTGSINVDIQDVNDAPVFKPQTILVSLVEHSITPGTTLTTVEAKDPDIVATNKIKYRLLNDTGDWLSINEDTGVITTKKELDRESHHVIKSKYIVKVLAVDDGVPPMTGTATLLINLKDINDNSPNLESAYLTTCENEEEAFLLTPIIDKDLEPYSGPFYVNVLDKDHDKKPLKLINYDDDIIKVKKEKDAYQGNHTLHLEIYDLQGKVSHQNLTVYVCDCLGGDACVEKMQAPPTLSGGAIALLLLAPILFLLLCFLLCKIQFAKVMIPVENEPLNSIMVYNEEGGNKDCEASAIIPDIGNMADFASKEEIDSNFHRSSTRRASAPAPGHNKVRVARSNSIQVQSNGHAGNQIVAGTAFDRANRRRHSSYHRENYHRQRRYGHVNRNHSLRHTSIRQYSSVTASSLSLQRKPLKTLESALLQKLSANMNETELYQPRVYAEEGELSRVCSLDSISISGSSVHLSSLQNFGSKFNILESICEHHMNLPKTDPKTEGFSLQSQQV
ncbi:cadherin-like protein 26 [Rana temporaria]|uniref:cadherin-like protein 26 n=1 Tax=Rana temporaria TaxID=8407 RepID=UPI001AACC6D3|nr:cadherin-like protein 26 [Rana temporaria]